MIRTAVCVRLLLACAIVSAASASAQSTDDNLKSKLSDASYIFNRFDELTEGYETEIDTWQIDASSKKLFKEEFEAVATNVHAEKTRLNTVLARRQVSAVDLFDVNQELLEISAELSGQSSNIVSWGANASQAIEFARLAGRASIVGAQLGVILRDRLNEQAVELKGCMSKR